MQQLSNTTKQEIIKLFEIALRPISAKVKSFGEPFTMGYFAQMGNGPETRRDETLWTVTFNSNCGEFTLTVSSFHLPDPWDMVEVPIRMDFFSFRNKIPNDKLQEISELLYSDDFLSLRIKKAV